MVIWQMPNLQTSGQSRVRDAARRSWAVAREKGRAAFYIGVVLVAVALACDLVVVTGAIAYSKLLAMTQPQLLFTAAIAIVFVLIVAPLIGLAVARPLWKWVDRQLS
ncbi:MAG TPA: hypothetical protein V6D22_11620 [Candidatus Obscuribacterales bacterium]